MTNTTMNATTTMTRESLVTENNKLGLQAYDLVKTTGKGIGIVLPKPSLDDELVVYSMSSVTETHPHDDDGMAKVRRYNEDGTIAKYSEKTGKALPNREKYAIEGIVGIKSYTNPIVALKDFINQNEDIEFDPVVGEVIVEEIEEDFDDYDCDYEDDSADETESTQMKINMKILKALDKILAKLG